MENVSDAVGSTSVTEEGASDAVENVSDAVGSTSVSRRRAPLVQWRMSLMRLGALLSRRRAPAYDNHFSTMTRRDRRALWQYFNPRPVRAFAITRTVGGGGGGVQPPGDRLLVVVELRGKKQSVRLDEISRLHIIFLVLGQHLT